MEAPRAGSFHCQLPVGARAKARNRARGREAWRLLYGRGMRPRTLLGDVQQETALRPVRPAGNDSDTYERVRRTLNEALAELQLPGRDRDDSGMIKLPRPAAAR
ncbi:MAG TPA: hypothetical protein VN947_14015 [Polyangia bacterium]|nr:hypothetical protein [Polyangia bacterium]